MSFLRRIFFGPPPAEWQHPVLGKLILIDVKNGAYWEGEPVVDGESIGLAVETADSAPPSETQVQFFQRTVADLDGAFNRAAPLLVPEYEKWVRAKFPKQWRSAFKLVGFSVPLDGLETNPWEISYECLTDKAGHHFTCYFEAGKPSDVSIDG